MRDPKQAKKRATETFERLAGSVLRLFSYTLLLRIRMFPVTSLYCGYAGGTILLLQYDIFIGAGYDVLFHTILRIFIAEKKIGRSDVRSFIVKKKFDNSKSRKVAFQNPVSQLIPILATNRE